MARFSKKWERLAGAQERDKNLRHRLGSPLQACVMKTMGVHKTRIMGRGGRDTGR